MNPRDRVALVLVASLAACTVGPDYQPVDPELPVDWSVDVPAEDMGTDDKALQNWWTLIDDPVLNQLIGQAASGNYDLMTALARVREARARRGIAVGDWFPQIDGAGSYTRSEASDNGVPSAPSGTSFKATNLTSVGFDASWEIDVFGGIRRSVEAATADLDASADDFHNTMISLFGEVGINYIQVRELQERIRIAESNVDRQNKTLSLTKDRYKAEIAPELDVKQAESNLYTTESTIPSLRIQLRQALNRLAVLLGDGTGNFTEALGQPYFAGAGDAVQGKRGQCGEQCDEAGNRLQLAGAI